MKMIENQYKMTKYMLLLKDLLGIWKIKSINMWLQYQKNFIFDNLDNIVNKYNGMYRRKIKMKPLEVKTSTYIGFDVESNNKYPKIKVCDYVTIWKYKNKFAKDYKLNYSQEIKKTPLKTL